LKANTNILKETQKEAAQQLLSTIIEGVLDKKAYEVVSLDLTNIEEAMADYLVICEGNSPTQVRAIAENVEYEVKHRLREYPLSKEGYRSSEWVLIDYANIVVHVFLKERRTFYGLEELWGDAATTTHYAEDGSSSVSIS